jgi:hypothetical protein
MISAKPAYLLIAEIRWLTALESHESGNVQEVQGVLAYEPTWPCTDSLSALGIKYVALRFIHDNVARVRVEQIDVMGTPKL